MNWSAIGSCQSFFRTFLSLMQSGQGHSVLRAHLEHLSVCAVFLVAWLSIACSRGTNTVAPTPAPSAIEYFAAWGTRGDGPGQLDVPVAMAVDNDSNVFVADAGSGYIQKFSVGGEPRLSFQDDRLNVHPTDIAVDAGGGIYVADGKRGNIQIYAPDGKHYMELGTGAPPAVRPSLRIAVDAYGTLYVAGTKPFEIRKWNAGSRHLEVWAGGPTGPGLGGVEDPAALTIGGDGLVYESEAASGEIKVYGVSGDLVRTVTLPGDSGGARFSGIATNGKFIFAADARDPVLHVWKLDGSDYLREDLSSWISGGVETKRKIAVTPSGKLLILDPLSCRVLRFRLHL